MELIAVILLVLLVLFGEIGLYRRNGLKGLSYRCRFSETECTEGDSLQFVETVSNEKGDACAVAQGRTDHVLLAGLPGDKFLADRRKPLCHQFLFRAWTRQGQPCLEHHL